VPKVMTLIQPDLDDNECNPSSEDFDRPIQLASPGRSSIWHSIRRHRVGRRRRVCSGGRRFSCDQQALYVLHAVRSALSGVTTVVVIVWPVAWYVLARRWPTETVAMAKVNVAAFVLLAVGVLLTFPPFMDLLQGK